MSSDEDDQLLLQTMQQEAEAKVFYNKLNGNIVLSDGERARVQQWCAERCMEMLTDGCPASFLNIERLMRIALFMGDYSPGTARWLADAGLALVPLEMVKGVGDGQSLQAEK
jgi:hypothetical protein